MLIETMDFAVTNRHEILSEFDADRHKAIISKASETWNDFYPVKGHGRTNLVGIDSSWNFIPYQGFYVYAVDAVSMLGDGSYLVPPKFEVRISTLGTTRGDEAVSSPSIALASIGMKYELDQIKACIDKAELVTVDGSILARYYDRRQGGESSFHDNVKALMDQENLLFLSKTSFSNLVLKGDMGDMFYYNRISSKPGYSRPSLDKSGVSISYVRLSEYSPCIKLEVPGAVKDSEVEAMLNVLSDSSVDGYPYVLRLAHETGKISRLDMERLANLLGLGSEIGGRDVLGE
jgi:hypothetical protein